MNRCENCHSNKIYPVEIRFLNEDNSYDESQHPMQGYYCVECEICVEDNTAQGN